MIDISICLYSKAVGLYCSDIASNNYLNGVSKKKNGIMTN